MASGKTAFHVEQNPYEAFKRRLGAEIRRVRKVLELTQSEFAARLGLSSGQAQVSKWERGTEQPRTSSLHSIAELAGVTIGDLMKRASDGDAALMRASELGVTKAGQHLPEPIGSTAEQLIHRHTTPEMLDRWPGMIGAYQLIQLVYNLAFDLRLPEAELAKLDQWRRDMFASRDAAEMTPEGATEVG